MNALVRTATMAAWLLDVTCSLDRYCFNFSFIDLANLPQCVLDCTAIAGVGGQQDPAVVFVAPVVLCAQDAARCGPVCNVR